MLRKLDLVDSFDGRQVLVRCDLNVPISNSEIQDSGRILAAYETIDEVIAKNGRPVICSHLGRPDGVDEKYSLKPVFEFMKSHYPNLEFADSAAPDAAQTLIENLRFNNSETSKDQSHREQFAKDLLGEITDVVIDGFGVVHRKQASVYEVSKFADVYAGRTVEKELEVLKKLTENPERPYTLILGGSKVSDKLGVIDALLPKVDRMLIGGGMMFTFLKALGHEVGSSLLEEDQIDTAAEYIERAKQLGVEIILPVDVVVAENFDREANHETVSAAQFNSSSFGESGIGLDIGPATGKLFSDAISNSKTVFWNGPMGVFEFDSFAAGTKTVAKALSEMDGLSVVGGGDSASAVRHFGFADEAFGHISTGGGASLEYLEGKKLPGLEALYD